MRQQFKEFILATNAKGSGKASSYLRALDMLGEILALSKGPFAQLANIWGESSPSLIEKLYEYILVEQKSGIIFQTDHASSYWKGGYYSAALKSYRNFLVESNYERQLMEQYATDDFIPQAFEFEPEGLALIAKEYEVKQGKEIIRQVKTRANQNVFRKKILEIYSSTCCITGLNIAQLNRASHIIPWAERKDIRLDPSNGLCLSGTYDLAFDQHLISLDEDYRIIISGEIKEFYSKQAVKDHFEKFQGKKIMLPKSYLPKQEYLEVHREELV